jgi:hypothetical protein
MGDPATRALWLAIAIIASAGIGTIATFLSWVGGEPVPRALLVGGAGFAGAFGLILAAVKFASDRSSS